MGLVQNLKKKWNDWVDKTLAELSSAYIKQLAKQTSRKQDNCSSMESSPNNLTMEHRSTTIVTSSQDTSEKTTMEMTTDEMAAYLREWSIDMVEKADSIGAKDAIYKEFEEWIEVNPDDEDMELLVLEPITEVLEELEEDFEDALQSCLSDQRACCLL